MLKNKEPSKAVGKKEEERLQFMHCEPLNIIYFLKNYVHCALSGRFNCIVFLIYVCGGANMMFQNMYIFCNT